MTASTAQPTPDGRLPVGAVVALKSGELVKSRLTTLPGPLRRRLAWTMAVDTLTALDAVAEVVCVVSDQPALASRLGRAGLRGVRVIAEQRPAGMNAALRDAAEHLQRDGFSDVLACVGDLPALRPQSLRTVLRAAGAYERAFLPDATGVGTTMLHARGVALAPQFQGRSAAAHRDAGVVALTDDVLGTPVSDARRDVDTEVDLATAVGLGLGSASSPLLDPTTGRLGLYAALTVVTPPEPHGRAVTAAGVRVDLPVTALEPGLRALRPGQRLHAALGGGQALSAWL